MGKVENELILITGDDQFPDGTYILIIIIEGNALTFSYNPN